MRAVLITLLLLPGLSVSNPQPPTPTPSPSAASLTDEIDGCLSCHEDQTLSRTFPSGETQSLFVKRETHAGSVHGQKVGCLGCHAGFDELPHPEKPWATKREFTASFRDLCKSCHFETYSKALDGVHFSLMAKGDERAPFCVDCHGAHDVEKPAVPRAKISQMCSACHGDVAEVYEKSAHGRALTQGVTDVPVCTDCHRSHDIQDPRTQKSRLDMPQTCGSCHTDPSRMSKYGLSTNVLKSYLNDFHGMSATLYKEGDQKPRQITALCVDCHGVHDIERVRGEGVAAPAKLKARIVKTCQSCHRGAGEDFPAAWLSHYEPSWEKAPLVHAVGLFYKVFIPFIIGGLCLQILLHLWRVVVNR